jgi:hypothetical protein
MRAMSVADCALHLKIRRYSPTWVASSAAGSPLCVVVQPVEDQALGTLLPGAGEVGEDRAGMEAVLDSFKVVGAAVNAGGVRTGDVELLRNHDDTVGLVALRGVKSGNAYVPGLLEAGCGG